MAIYVALVVAFLWLLSLSWVLYSTKRHYQNLIAGTNKAKLNEILEELLTRDKAFGQEIEILKKEVAELTKKSNIPIQRIGLVRFNPFERVGGEQSFVLALLNNMNTGIVVNFIYTREGMRTFIKKVKEGEGEGHKLSEEELESVKKAVISSY